jgi:hypothetical protein
VKQVVAYSVAVVGVTAVVGVRAAAIAALAHQHYLFRLSGIS